MNRLLVLVLRLLTLALIVLGGCQATVQTPKRTVRARVTLYDSYHDKYGSRIAMTNKLRAIEGRTMAAPSAIAFNTRVTLPLLAGIVGNGKFNIEDRGSALEKAYRRGQLRLDVYVANRKKCRQLGVSLPEVMEATIE